MQLILIFLIIITINCGPPSDLVDPHEYEYFKIPYNKTFYSGYLEPD